MCWTSAWAVNWERLGINFESDPETYRFYKQNLLRASAEIASSLSAIMEEEIPNDIMAKFSDKKLTIVFQKNSATDAMFFPPRSFRQSVGEEWIITINPAVVTDANYHRLVTHEFFHAVHHANSPKEETWVREGMAQLFESNLFGGANQAHVIASLTKSEFSLEEDFNVNDYKPEKYGNTFLYFQYLSNQCAQNKDFLWDLMKTEATGRQGIDIYLRGKSNKAQCQSFIKSAGAFSLARLVNTYSGFEQNESTFLTPNTYKLEVSTTMDKLIQKDPRGFFKSLKAFRPVKLSLQSAELLSKFSTESSEWWAIEKSYPYRVKQVSPLEVPNLSKSWDIGLVIVQ